MRLDDLTIRHLQPPEKGQKTYRDPSLPGFACRVSVGGTKTFVLIHGKDRRFITIGRYPILSLSEARGEAKRLLAEFTLGRVRPQSITYQAAVELFLEEKGKARRARTVKDYRRLLGRLTFKGQLADLTHAELQRRLKRFTAPSEYNHLLVALKVFCTWAVKRRYIEHNPTTGLSTHQTTSRSRVLTDAELQLIWRACEQNGGLAGKSGRSENQQDGQPVTTPLPAHFATIVKLLILTGQRRGEIAALQTSFFKNDLCTLPPTLTKNKREHVLPLGAMAGELLRTCTTLGSSTGTGLLFPAKGKQTPFNGWSKSKAALDELSGVTNWTLHDLRRTYATRLAELGTAPHVIERLLNHVSGTISGISAIYNRHHFLPEMQDAVAKYEAWLTRTLRLV